MKRGNVHSGTVSSNAGNGKSNAFCIVEPWVCSNLCEYRYQIYESSFYEGNDNFASLGTIIPMATVFTLQSSWLLHLSYEAELLDIIVGHVRDEGSIRRMEIAALGPRHDMGVTTTVRRIVRWGEGVRGPSREQLSLA